MAVIGGLLNPILLHADRDQHASLFLYLGVLNAGVVGLGFARRWHAFATIALLGTQAIFWGWYAEHYHPEKLAAALGFQASLFALHLASGMLAPFFHRRRAGIEDLVRFALNAFLFSVAGYVLLDDKYHVWLGTAALVLGIVYALAAWMFLARWPDDQRQFLVALSTAMFFVATMFPIQASAVWIAVGWGVQGALLWWFGLRVSTGAVRAMGAILLILAAGRVVLVDAWDYAYREPFVPLFNKYGLPACVVAISLLGAALASRHFMGRLSTWDRVGRWSAAFGTVALVWFILSFEAYTFFTAQIDQRMARISNEFGGDFVDDQGRPLRDTDFEEAEHLRRVGRTTLSAVWSIYAAVLLAVGFGLRSPPLRWAALGLFGLTLCKVVLIDMQRLPGLYRVAAFLILSLGMAAAAWGYQRVKDTLHASAGEGTA